MRFRFLIVFFLVYSNLFAQAAIERPPIWGIAKMTFLASDFKMARDYYGKFLGFDVPFSYDSEAGRVISFKVNDRQFLEFREDPAAREKNRFVSVSLETEDAEMMRKYLKSRGIQVPGEVRTDGAGNRVFETRDPSGNAVEFIEFSANGLHLQSKGKFLPETRISRRIHHAGLYTDTLRDDDVFYSRALNFPEILRYPEDKSQDPVMIYFGMGDCTESIEHYAPSDSNFTHPCFLVDDMQETVNTLRDRRTVEVLGKPVIGKGKRWILNITNPDGTKVEFTEAYTVR